MEALGANVSAEDRHRLLELKSSGWRLAQVEEFELMITYIDRANDARFVHFKHGFGSSGQHFEKCIAKPNTIVDLLGT
jgi:hypothetical protein